MIGELRDRVRPRDPAEVVVMLSPSVERVPGATRSRRGVEARRILHFLLLRLRYPTRFLSPVLQQLTWLQKVAACFLLLVIFTFLGLRAYIRLTTYYFSTYYDLPVHWLPLLYNPLLRFPVVSLTSTTAQSFFNQSLSIFQKDPYSASWSGLRKEDEPFNTSQQYLFIPRGHDWCVGFNHFLASLKCRVLEAERMGRTLVLDDEYCTNGVHARDGQSRVQPLYAYIDMERVRRHTPFVPLPSFQAALKSYRDSHPTSNLSLMILPAKYRVYTSAVTRHEPQPLVVVRDISSSPYPFAFRVCHAYPIVREQEKHEVWPHPSLRRIARSIAAHINASHFTAVHVRRGDKARDRERWPHLERDTRPESLAKRLPQLVPPGSALYIATNELTPHFFAPLKRLYLVHTVDDFAHLWAPGSPWYSDMRALLGAKPLFDDTMRGIVDYGVSFLAARRIETFNDLTSDPKEGRENLLHKVLGM